MTRTTPATTDFLWAMIAALLVLGSMAGGLFAYQNTRDFVANSNLPIFPEPQSDPARLPTPQNIALNLATATATLTAATAVPATVELGTPEPQPTATTDTLLTAPTATMAPPPLGSTEPLTILVMGIDNRKGEENGPRRSDTIILMRVDPVTRQIGMLSFPRDLYITLPDYGEGEHLDRINTALWRGDVAEYPGGGAALAKQMIRRNFGIQVDRYIIMNFDGFRKIIDEIGGITIDVPEDIVDYDYPTEDYGIMTVRFEEGRQTMDGERALIYARTRKSTSDFARAERQQQVILAVRDKVLSLDILPSLTPARIANLVATVDESIETDLTLDELLMLVQAAQDVEISDIERNVIALTDVREFRTDGGADVLIPRWPQVLELVRQTFDVELLPIAATPAVPTPRPTLAPTASRPAIIYQTRAETRVQIRNGSRTDGLDQIASANLQAAGFTIFGAFPDERRDYSSTTIYILNAAAERTAYALQDELGVGYVQYLNRRPDTADVIVVLGDDYVP